MNAPYPPGMTGPWGLNVSPARRNIGASYIAANRAELSADTGNIKPVDWFDCCLPCDDQGKLQACIGYGTKNWFEAMIRKVCGRDAIPAGMAIDPLVIWRTALESEGHAGQNVGVSTARAGLDAAKKLGLLGPSCRIVEVGPSLEALSMSMQETPLVVGLQLHPGWIPANINKEFGTVDEDPWTKLGFCGGHCMLMAALLRHPESGVWAPVYQNSWTADYAFKGFVLASHGDFMWCYMGEGPFTVAGYDPATDRSWEKFLVKDEARGTV